MNKLFYILMTSTALLCMKPDDVQGGGSGAGGTGDGKADAPTSLIDVNAIKKADGAPAADPNAADPNKKPDDQKPVDQPGQKMARPEWLKADKFWDEEKGQIRTEEMNKAYAELEKKFTNGDHKAPAKAEDYKLTIPDEKKAILFGDAKADHTADPGYKMATEWATKNKVSQDALNELLSNYADLMEPEQAKMIVNLEAEKAILGKNADAVIKNQMDFLSHLFKSGHINEKHLDELSILAETGAGIQALQAIRAYYGEQPIPTNATEGAGMPTREELSAMVNDKRYDTDPDFKAKTDALYAKRYGTAAAISSAQNR